MGFFAPIRDRLKIKAKQAQLKKNPTPIALCELVQCHLRLGELEAAFEYTSWGQKRFPDSEIVGEMHRVVVRERARVGIQRVGQELQENPTAEGFMKLAGFAVQLRDVETASKALRECARRFPEFSGAYSQLAEIHERRFLRDLSAADGLAVLNYSQKACRLDPTDLDTQMRFAAFLARVGAEYLARRVASAVLAKDGRREDARELLDQLAEDPKPQSTEELESLLVKIEEEGKLPGDVQEVYRIQREVGRLCRGIREVKEKLGARRAVVLNPETEAFDDLGPLGVDAFVNLSANLARSSHLSTRRTDLGPLRGVTLESNGGSLVLRRGYRCVVGCLLPRDASILGSQELLRSLVEAGAPANKDGGAAE